MMMTLLLIKSRMKTFYEKHYRIVRGILKAVFVFISLVLITREMNYSGVFGQYWILGLVALFCSVTPDIASACFVFLVIGWEMFCAVPVIAAFAVFVFVIYFLLFGKLEPAQVYVVLMVPVLSMLKLDGIVPVAVALFASPVMIPAMAMGVILQYIMVGTAQYMTAFTGSSGTDKILMSFQYIIHYLGQNSMLAVTLLAFSISFICVYLIRRASFKYGSQIAILVGTLVLLVVELFANIILDLDMNPLGFTLRAVAALAISFILQFFRITLDYHGTRKLQFEDDEYYYYVTAIPKYKVAVVDKTVTRIVPEETAESLDLKEELEKTLEEENEEPDSE